MQTVDYRTHRICYNMCTQRNPFNWSEQLYQKHNEVAWRA